LKKLLEIGTIAGGAALLCWIAFYNGFPLVYSDGGTYLESGFTLETPLDRPIMYGLFMRAASFNGLTLWSVIFIQSLMLVWMIRETVAVLFPENKTTPLTMLLLVLLAVCTGLPWIASQLIADIFTPIGVLALFVALFGRHSRGKTTVLFFILLVACACHISNVMICFAAAAATGIIHFIRHRRNKPLIVRRKHIFIAMLLPVLALLTMVSSISKSRHVFMMGHLIETGILHAYLDDHCATEEISFCRYRDRIPEGAETFIWNSDGDSALILTGGWLGSKEEYSRIISETFSEGKYLKMHFAAAVSGTLRQLATIRVGEGLGRYDSAQLVSQRIRKYFPHEHERYLQSRQSADEFGESKVMDAINKISTVLALLVIAAWLVMRGKKPEVLLFTALTALLAFAYLLNCGICATLATVANRFGARLSWMAVLLAVLLASEWIIASRKKTYADQ
jgi:hypothetical protein